MQRKFERLPEITELLTFIVASDEQSLSRAAARLHISGAAVAKRLDNLEAILGRKLLQRGNRGVRLTAAGRELYLPAEQLVEGARAVLDSTRPAAGGKLAGIQALLKRPAARSPEALAAELERLLERLFDVVPVGIAVQRLPDGTFLEVNDAFCTMVGYPRRELVGQSSSDLGLWISAEERERASSQMAETGRAECRRTRIRTASDAAIRVDVVSERMTVANQQLVLTVVADVTHETDLEQRLVTGDRRCSLLLELAEMALGSARRDALLAAALRAVKSELGFSDVAVVAFRDGDEPGEVLRALGAGKQLGEIARLHRQVWEGAEFLTELDAAATMCVSIPGSRAEPRVLLARAARDAELSDDDRGFLRSIARMIARVLDAPAE